MKNRWVVQLAEKVRQNKTELKKESDNIQEARIIQTSKVTGVMLPIRSTT